MSLNTAGDLGEDGLDNLLIEIIPGYEGRVNDILATFVAKGSSPNKGRTLPIGKRVIDNFLRTLLANSISPRHTEYIIEHGIVVDANFQTLIMEIGKYNMSNGTPERFLQLLLDNPGIFHNREYILQDKEIQGILQKRILLLEEHQQNGVIDIIKELFINPSVVD